MSRIGQKFTALKNEGRKGLVTFITAGDPDAKTSQDVLNKLAESGADFIELGMPFTDPMADGPAIQAAGLRALEAGGCMVQTLDMVRNFRDLDDETPLILMGYYNPIYQYGSEKFISDAQDAGVDGLIVVDLPPEEADELNVPAQKAGLDIIRLVTPTTDSARLPKVLDGASGFLYYVSITGVTGTKSAAVDEVNAHIKEIRNHTNLPIAIGFGIKTPDDVIRMTGEADAAVVGSAIVETIGAIANDEKSSDDVCSQVRQLSNALRA